MRFFVTLNILILVLIVLRKLMKGKVSCRVQYFSWIILPLFMLVGSFVSIPVSIEKQRDVVEDKTSAVTYNNEAADLSMAAYPVEREYPNAGTIEKDSEASAVEVSQAEAAASGSFTIEYKTVALAIWISGSVLYGAIILIHNISFSRRIRKARKWFANSPYGNLKVYKLKGLDSPFLLWNKIYIPEELDPDSEHYSLSLYHEYCHYKLGDCFWNVIRNLFLIVLWFDPLVWIAYFLIRHDNELSVDEMVIKGNDEENRVKYGEMLLSYVSKISGYNRISSVATSMSGKSKSFMKKRILNIAKTSTATKYAAVIVSTVLITASVCLLIKPHIIYTYADKPDVEVLAAPSSQTEETQAEPQSSSTSSEDTFTPPSRRNINFGTDNLIGAEDFKIPEDVDQSQHIFLNCDVINITGDYMYICIRGVDYEKWENVYRICRYEMVDGKQGDLAGWVELDGSCACVLDVYERDGKTYALLNNAHQTNQGYAFDISELDFENRTITQSREVYLHKVLGGYIHISYARYSDGTIYAFGSIWQTGTDEFGYYEITDDGFTRIEPDSKTINKFWRILEPEFKL